MAIISNAVTIADAGAFSASLGSQVLIKTLTASNDGTLSFVDGASGVVLDNTYPIYKIEIIGVHPSADNRDLDFNVSIDGGTNYNVVKTTTNFYTYHNESGNTSSLEYNPYSDQSQVPEQVEFMENVGGDNDQSGSGEIFLYNPSSTTFVKHFTVSTTHYSANNYNKHSYMAGYANTTSAVNAVQFKFDSDNIEAGIIKLYGIKDS